MLSAPVKLRREGRVADDLYMNILDVYLGVPFLGSSARCRYVDAMVAGYERERARCQSRGVILGLRASCMQSEISATSDMALCEDILSTTWGC